MRSLRPNTLPAPRLSSRWAALALPLALVCGFGAPPAAARDKQLPEMLAAARGRFDHVLLTRYGSNQRAAAIPALLDACRQARLPNPQVADSPTAGLATARRLAGRGGVVVVAGSFFLAAEVRRAAGITRRR